MHVYALHGFLGMPSDWNGLAQVLPPHQITAQSLQCPPIDSFNAWTSKFNRAAKKDPRPKVLLGYSLGGRLAMHALLSSPQEWKAAILISCHPGLPCEKMKAERRKTDQSWANQFLVKPWLELMEQWNQGSVLSSSPPLERREEDYSRQELGHQLLYWSLSEQDDLTPRLTEVNVPLLWITGERDLTYTQIASKLTFRHPLSQKWIAPQAGHRVPWEIPEAFSEKIQDFLSSREMLIDCGISTKKDEVTKTQR